MGEKAGDSGTRSEVGASGDSGNRGRCHDVPDLCAISPLSTGLGLPNPLSRIGRSEHSHQVIGADASVSNEGQPGEEEGAETPISCRQAVGKLFRERPGSQPVRGAGRGIRL